LLLLLLWHHRQPRPPPSSAVGVPLPRRDLRGTSPAAGSPKRDKEKDKEKEKDNPTAAADAAAAAAATTTIYSSLRINNMTDFASFDFVIRRPASVGVFEVVLDNEGVCVG
tara:strand:- start:72 stop:404 length:333 start_codon:yes stop_codon:yes gene_type:complete